AAQAQPNGLFTSFRKRLLILGLLLAIATVTLYYPVHGHPFVNYDDGLYVAENDQVQAGLTWPTVKWAFTTFEVGTWHPLTWISHALDCELFGVDPAAHHDINLLLHTLNVVLLFWVLQAATGHAGRSARMFSACCFSCSRSVHIVGTPVSPRSVDTRLSPSCICWDCSPNRW